MTHFTNQIQLSGPLLTVHVCISVPRAQALAANGAPTPAPVQTSLLIDTGASHTCIDKAVIAALQLTPTGTIMMHTPSSGALPSSASTFDVGLIVLGISPADQHVLPVHSVSECDLSAQGIHGLLGRDILMHSRLTYSGPDGMYFLSF